MAPGAVRREVDCNCRGRLLESRQEERPKVWDLWRSNAPSSLGLGSNDPELRELRFLLSLQVPSTSSLEVHPEGRQVLFFPTLQFYRSAFEVERGFFFLFFSFFWGWGNMNSKGKSVLKGEDGLFRGCAGG